MAVTGRGLRYYRGGYNPGAAFSDGSDQAPIFSMYNPEAEAQYIDAVSQRQGRFDTTVAAFAAEKARIGETETYDLPELNKRLQSFESGINNLVKDKYNGDYSAAANEIAKMIGTERTNPFYHFNKQKVEMSKAYLDAKMKLGSNFLSVGNPLEVKFEDWQNGKTFDFTPVNREDVVKQSAIEFSSLANTIMSDPKLQSTAGGQYFLSTMQYGLKDPQELMRYLQSEPGQQMVNNIIQNNPTLSQLPQDQVMSAIAEGAHTAIGKTVKDYMADQSYLDRLQQARLAASAGGGGQNKIIPIGADKMPIEEGAIYSSPVMIGYKDRYAQEEGKKMGISVKSWQELKDTKGRDAKRALNAAKEKLEQTYVKEFQNTAIPVYGLNYGFAGESKDYTTIKANRDALNDTFNQIPIGSIVGIDSDNTKKLEGLTDKKVKGVSLIPTGSIGNPFIIKAQIEGTPESKGGKKPNDIPVDVLISDPLAASNMFGTLITIDPRIMGTIYNAYNEIPGGKEIQKALIQSGYNPEQ